MDFLMTNFLWWHWVIFGIVLVVAEIIVPLFVIIWFGLAAIMIGILTFFLSIALMPQLALWILFSLLLLFIWFRYFQEKDISESGQADYRLNTKGIVIEDIPHGGRGRVRFEAPVLGSSEWHATSEASLKKGTVVHIVDVNGQLIKVGKE